MKKVGLYFGSFNPVHQGHLIIAQSILNKGGLDEIRWIITPQNPLKNPLDLAPEEDRFNMVKLALQDHPRMTASRVEFEMPRPSYTIDTLDHLKALEPHTNFVVIMGEDSYVALPKWKSWERILNEYAVIVFPRETSSSNNNAVPAADNVQFIQAPLIGISSTMLRTMISASQDIRFHTPDAVRSYLREHALYQTNA